jgi:hypothetical protein
MTIKFQNNWQYSVSEWKSVGEERGYWQYFQKEVLVDIFEKFEKEVLKDLQNEIKDIKNPKSNIKFRDGIYHCMNILNELIITL